ncbi:RDD family protein [Streptomyces sp. NPDC006784]|uniref:RDD family protein n=1 Tax=Streptomyces sp. NPDC006784 TaxID=3364764 RepID=UPI003696B428
MSELVTGEAVLLGLRPARLPSRALAVCMDLVIVWVLYLALTLALLVSVDSLDTAALAAVQVGLFVVVLVGLPIAVETLTGGRSVGKIAAGLRVVRDDGGPIRFRHALVRGAVGVVEMQLLFGVVACTASLVSERGRRLGDVFAGTLVVRERSPRLRQTAVPPPPQWCAAEFAELDLSHVPDALWLAIRQFLLRAEQLDPAVRHSMAERLADDVIARTGAPVPQGVPAVSYLAGVAAERREREARRSFGSPGMPHSSSPEPQPSPQSQPQPQPSPSTATPSPPGSGRESSASDGGENGPSAPRTGFVPPS